MPRVDPDEQRAVILAAASACFSRKGFHRTTMDEIVAESGLSKGTLYWYYKSKNKHKFEDAIMVKKGDEIYPLYLLCIVTSADNQVIREEETIFNHEHNFAHVLRRYSDPSKEDDWGLDKFIKEQRHDLLEILEDRHALRSTLVTSQVPVKHWHEVVDDPTLADAILDRLVHNAYKLVLNGESMRKKRSKLT